MIKYMSRDGTSIDIFDEYGRTQLLVALYNLDYETAKFLISAGADVDLRNYGGMND